MKIEWKYWEKIKLFWNLNENIEEENHKHLSVIEWKYWKTYKTQFEDWKYWKMNNFFNDWIKILKNVEQLFWRLSENIEKWTTIILKIERKYWKM